MSLRRRMIAVVPLALAALGAARTAPAGATCSGSVDAQRVLHVEAYDTGEHFPEIEAKLDKGLSVTIAHEASWRGVEPVTFGCKIFYDLWDEAYDVTLLSGSLAAGGARRTWKARRDALKACFTTSVRGIAAGARDFVLTTHLDPISDETLARTRKWLAEKGISGSASGVVGRAAYAIIDLKQEEAFSRRCPIGAGP
jgi:hypothetical protein